MRNLCWSSSVVKPGLSEDEAKDGDDDDDDEPINPLVDALFDEVEYLRMQVRRLSISPYSPRTIIIFSCTKLR